MVTQLKTIYTDYAEITKAVRKKARAFDGIFGLGKDPRKDPCHEAFYDQVGAWVTEFLATEPTQDVLMEVAMYLVEVPAEYKNEECYWFMFAAQGHMKPMIGQLTPENRTQLKTRLEQLYKKMDRMPLQNELLKMLAGKKK